MGRLRSGYTTGACAAAAAKAAMLFAGRGQAPDRVEIPFPDGSRHAFAVHRTWQQPARTEGKNGKNEDYPCFRPNELVASGIPVADENENRRCPQFFAATVIKDAGDDPDVTNGAEIVALVTLEPAPQPAAGEEHDCVEEVAAAPRILLCRGAGVGWVSKPGLAIDPGEPAINPVPRRMIVAAVREALAETGGEAAPGFCPCPATIRITIAIPGGEALADKTLNRRLGIIGGLSILGTTGIVRPVSAEAWTATIAASLDVARATGLAEVVLATGRTSEKGVQRLLSLPEEAYAMMGDYLHFSLTEAGQRGFKHLHLAGMWAKIVKAALKIPQTHVRHGALEVRNAAALLAELGAPPELAAELATANTAREILVRLQEAGAAELIDAVCRRAGEYAAQTAGVPVTVYLVDSNMKVINIQRPRRQQSTRLG